jgi:hypothetical protein
MSDKSEGLAVKKIITVMGLGLAVATGTLLLVEKIFRPVITSPTVADSTTIPEVSATNMVADDPKVQAILDKFTHEEISQMLVDIPLSDHRPESERSFDLLSKALKEIERRKNNPRLKRADRVNEALKDL